LHLFEFFTALFAAILIGRHVVRRIPSRTGDFGAIESIQRYLANDNLAQLFQPELD